MGRQVKRMRRGQITIPKEFRDAMGLRANDLLEISFEDGKLVVEPATITRTMGSPWLRALYDHHVSGREPRPEVQEPASDLPMEAVKKARSRRARD